MKITHAVIPAAGRGLKPYPAWDTVEKLLHPLLDRDGLAKPVLQILGDEVLAAGVERIVLVVGPDEEQAYRAQLTELITTLARSTRVPAQRQQAERLQQIFDRLVFVTQPESDGFGRAVLRAADQVDGDHFLLALSDHLFLSNGPTSCAEQIVNEARRLDAPVSSVEPLAEHLIHRYGVVGGRPLPGRADCWQVTAVVEKPTPTQAELHLATPGLRRGNYLCFSGLHVLPTQVFDLLQRWWDEGAEDRGELTPVLSQMVAEGGWHAMQLDGRHQDIGSKFGLLEAQLERSLQGPDREAVLTGLCEILARDGLMRSGR